MEEKDRQTMRGNEGRRKEGGERMRGRKARREGRRYVDEGRK